MTDIAITSDQDIVELQEEFENVIEVTNVNGSSKAGIVDRFIPTSGQTIFTLSQIPNASQILLSQAYLNGQDIDLGTSYTISGSQLIVILPYLLSNQDDLKIYY